MARGFLILVTALGLSIGSASAQEVDARAALQASLKAMGGENLKTLEYSGAGSSALIGQQFAVDVGWPQYEVADYTRAIDFDARWSREDYTRRQGNFPTFGRMPMADQRITAIVSGAYAWDIRDNAPVPLTRPISGRDSLQRAPPAGDRDHARTDSSRRPWPPRTPRPSGCSSSAHPISASPSSDDG